MMLMRTILNRVAGSLECRPCPLVRPARWLAQPSGSKRRPGLRFALARALIIGGVLCGANVFLGSAASPDTNVPPRDARPPAQTTATAARPDYAAFRIISERNIFNVNRSGRQSGGSRDRRKPAKIDTFGLVGTLQNEQGFHALFDGSSSDYRKDLKCSGTIAGYKIADINFQGVRIENGPHKINLRVGSQMRREDEGEWKLSASTEPLPASGSSSSSSSGSSSSASSGDMSDALKRLMQQREQELK
jgi:hypothetical protein